MDRYLQESLTEPERQELTAALGSRSNEEQARELILEHLKNGQFNFEPGLEKLYTRIENQLNSEPPRISANRLHFLRSRFFRYAAAIIILMGGIITAIVVSPDRKSTKSDTVLAHIVPADIHPGTNKAMLTVDNKNIDLSSDKTGIRVGNDVTYADGEKLSESGTMIMLATPNGGQYQIVLPDGTKAWLNAASSISFPSAFNNENRKIKVTGEVYLEVAQNKAKPFWVDVDGQSSVQVLGTSFNVNSYNDDGYIKTTLIEGSVSVLPNNTPTIKNYSVILKPGQQALQPIASGTGDKDLQQSGKIILTTADINQALAWKNGIFDFNGLGVRAMMAQLARWYDIDIRYEGPVPANILKGKMYRNEQLSFVLDGLRDMGIKCKMEEKTLIVL